MIGRRLRWIAAILTAVLIFAGLTESVSAFGSSMLRGKPLQTGSYLTVAKVTRTSAPIHVKAHSSSKVMGTVKRGEEYPILSVAKYHYQIRLLGGKKGWVRKQYMNARLADRYVAGWNYLGGTDDFIQAGSIAGLGLDIVMPRWYRLEQDGLLSAQPDRRYVAWAHSEGKKVWAMIGNQFDIELTDRFLSSPENRAEVVGTLAASVAEYGIDGINVDFENMKMKNREDFVCFIRELKAALGAEGKAVSVDVTRENPDPDWSGSYNRAALGAAADYIVMMGYEEYYSGRGEAGPVGSLSWVEEGLRLLLKDVPAHKVMLGVPFHARVWMEPAAGGRAVAKDLMISDTETFLTDHQLTKTWDAAAQQNYVEYTDGDGVHRLWVEDTASMAKRWALVRKYSLAGAAAWAIGQESADIWTVVQ